MSEYIKQNFTSGQILKAEHLNHMEDGIESNANAVTLLSEEIARQPYATVADMIADESLAPGMVVQTLGYFAENDGGDSKYIITDDVEPNGLDIISLNNGLCAVLQHDGHIRARQCGVPDDDKTSTKFMEMWDRFNGVAESIDVNVHRAYTNKTLVLNDVTEVFSSNSMRQNIAWNGEYDNAVISVVDGNGTIFDGPKSWKQRIRLHDLYIVAGGAKVGVNLMCAIGMRTMIDRVSVLDGAFGFVFGINWSCNIGELNASYQKLASFYTMPAWDTEYFTVSPMNTSLSINALTIHGLYAARSPRGVWFPALGGEIHIGVINVESLSSEDGIAVEFGAVSGTIDTIHIESDQVVHAYDLYVDTHQEHNTNYESWYRYKSAASLNINEVRGRRFYLNGNVTIAALTVIQWATDDYTASPLLFEGGEFANEVNILFRPSSFYLDGVDMPYGFCGTGYEYFKNLPMQRKLENLLMLGEGSAYTEITDDSAAIIKNVPANSAKWAGIKKVYGSTHQRPFTQLVQNPNDVLDVYGAKYMIEFAVGRKIYAGHKYLFAYSHTGAADAWMSIAVYKNGVSGNILSSGYMLHDDEHNQYYGIGEATADGERVSDNNNADGNIVLYGEIQNGTGTNFQIYDLTTIYGEGNEPTTLAEFRADYPLLNYAGCQNELKHAVVQEIITSAGDILRVGKTFSRFEGYGQSYGDVRNYVDLEAKVFHRYGYYDDENKWITDEKEFSISYALLPHMVSVESGGTISFVLGEDGFDLIPASAVMYMVKPN